MNINNIIKDLYKYKNDEYDTKFINKVIKYFEKSLIKQLKLMIPKIDFGCVSSGGIVQNTQPYTSISSFKDTELPFK